MDNHVQPDPIPNSSYNLESFSIEGVSFSPTTKELDNALAQAQGKIKAAKKNAENNAFKKDGKASKFADLEAVYEACRGALTEAGISITQWPTVATDFSKVLMTTRIAKAGEFMISSMAMPTRDRSAHGVSGAITYARRVHLNSIVGIAADEEDDGNNASGLDDQGKPKDPQQGQGKAPIKNQAPGGQQKPENKPPTDPFPPDDAPRQAAIQELYSLAEELGLTPLKSKQIIEMALGKVVKSTNLTLAEAQEVISFIKQMP